MIDEVDIEEGRSQRVALDHQLTESLGIGVAGLEEGVDLGLNGRDVFLERLFRLAVDLVDHVPGGDLFVGQLEKGGDRVVGGLDDRRRLHLLRRKRRNDTQSDQGDQKLLHLVASPFGIWWSTGESAFELSPFRRTSRPLVDIARA